MKTILLGALLLSSVACQKKDSAPEIEKELFSFLVTNQNPAAPKCDPAFVTLRNDELTIFCHPLDTTDIEMKEWTKRETTNVTIKWAEARNKSFNSILTRYTDEIVADSKK